MSATAKPIRTEELSAPDIRVSVKQTFGLDVANDFQVPAFYGSS